MSFIEKQFSDAAEKRHIASSAVKTFEELAKKNVESWGELSKLTIQNCENIVVTTTIKDRLDFFKVSLINWLKFPFKRIYVTDWDSKEDIRSFIDEHQDGRIVFAKVTNEPQYRHSAARNFKMHLVEEDCVVLSIDCDILLSHKFLNNIFVKKNIMYTVNPKYAVNGTAGTSLFTKEMYFNVGGTNEHMNFGWGREDMDLYDRISLKYRNLCLSQDQIYHQPHSDSLRVKYTKEKNKWISNARNMNVSKLLTNGVLVEEYKNPYKVYYPNGMVRSFND